jgi:hypothetical protein
MFNVVDGPFAPLHYCQCYQQPANTDTHHAWARVNKPVRADPPQKIMKFWNLDFKMLLGEIQHHHHPVFDNNDEPDITTGTLLHTTLPAG